MPHIARAFFEVSAWFDPPVRRRTGPVVVRCRPRRYETDELLEFSIQRKTEEVARRLEVVVFLRMDVPPTLLHGEILLRPYRVGDRSALERCADIEPPE